MTVVVVTESSGVEHNLHSNIIMKKPSATSISPLSASAMSKFRCPSRLDFLAQVQALPAPTPRAKSFALGQAPPSLVDSTLVIAEKNIHDDDDDEEEGVPEQMTSSFLDAMDRVEACAELKALVMWLDQVRKRHNVLMKMTDVDLQNGVALLDVLYLVDAKWFVELEYGQGGRVGKYVERNGNGEKNLQVLRNVLANVEWRDSDDGGRKLGKRQFADKTAWEMGPYVLFAAYMGDRKDDMFGDLNVFDDQVVKSLEESLDNILTELLREDDNVYWRERVRKAEEREKKERQKRIDLEMKCMEMEKEMKKKVVRRNQVVNVTNGKMVTELRMENAKLRRKVADLEKKIQVNDKEMYRLAKEVRRRPK